MKYLMINLFPIICVGISAYLINADKDHWGWFIFLAIISSHTFNGKCND